MKPKHYKLTIAPISFIITPLTKRKTCPFCNGKGWHKYDIGKDGCELCGGIPGASFKDTLIVAMENSVLNICYFERYFSKDDWAKIELSRDLLNEKYKNFELTKDIEENAPRYLKVEEIIK